MQRITKKMVQARFENAMRELGWPHGDAWGEDNKAKIGTYVLDHNSFYGGYRIERVANSSGAMATPFGNMRYAPKDFVNVLGVMMDTVRIQRGQ